MLRSRCSQFVHLSKQATKKSYSSGALKSNKPPEIEVQKLINPFAVVQGKEKKNEEKKNNIENFPFPFPHYQLVVSSSHIYSSGTPCISLPVKY